MHYASKHKQSHIHTHTRKHTYVHRVTYTESHSTIQTHLDYCPITNITVAPKPANGQGKHCNRACNQLCYIAINTCTLHTQNVCKDKQVTNACGWYMFRNVA